MNVFIAVFFLSSIAGYLGLYLATGFGPYLVGFAVNAFLGLLLAWLVRLSRA